MHLSAMLRHVLDRSSVPCRRSSSAVKARLGDLEITVTPVGGFDRRSVEAYEAAGVHRLVVLPKHDASHAQRHDPLPRDDILRNIEAVSQIVGGAMD